VVQSLYGPLDWLRIGPWQAPRVIGPSGPEVLQVYGPTIKELIHEQSATAS
jgi:hypothetical protein